MLVNVNQTEWNNLRVDVEMVHVTEERSGNSAGLQNQWMAELKIVTVACN